MQDTNKSTKNQKARDTNSMDNASNPSSGYNAANSEAVVPAIGKKKKVDIQAKRRETMKNPPVGKNMITSKDNTNQKTRKSVKEFNTPKVESDNNESSEKMASPTAKNLDSAEKRKRASSQQEDSKSKQNSDRQETEATK